VLNNEIYLISTDRSMQLNEARFLQNGKCGYVLKPSYLREYSSDYNPSSVYSLTDETAVSFIVMVLNLIIIFNCSAKN
jgi:hypothetical protein